MAWIFSSAFLSFVIFCLASRAGIYLERTNHRHYPIEATAALFAVIQIMLGYYL